MKSLITQCRCNRYKPHTMIPVQGLEWEPNFKIQPCRTALASASRLQVFKL